MLVHVLAAPLLVHPPANDLGKTVRDGPCLLEPLLVILEIPVKFLASV